MTDCSAIEAALGHRFENPALLDLALTHSSHAFEHGGVDNERLEFLGDSIVNTCTTLLLLDRFPVHREGALSRLRSRLVNTDTLAAIGRAMGIGALLKLGRGEEASGGREKTSLLADATEAVLGALFVDAGFERCREIVGAWMGPRIEELALGAGQDGTWKDPRSRLQELAQQRWRVTPLYEVVVVEGPPHAPVFEVAVRVGERRLGSGRGTSKREGAKRAAAAALEVLETELPNDEGNA